MTWVATVNNHLLVHQPILSRFRVFHIRQPVGGNAIVLAQGVADTALRKVLPGAKAVQRRIAVELAHLTHREICQAVEDAAAAAAEDGRRFLKPADLPAWALHSEEAAAPPVLH